DMQEFVDKVIVSSNRDDMVIATLYGLKIMEVMIQAGSRRNKKVSEVVSNREMQSSETPEGSEE
ncbi:MAG: hypothetical protein KDI65_08490, partial [Alphaproteobacteria bacterium]|nr:hypothetical protein [Alphaproteobacteria bacterium]